MKKAWKVLSVTILLSMITSAVWAGPTQVKDLSGTGTGPNTGRAEGTASAGTLLEVDLRISTVAITALNWSSRTRVTATVPVGGTHFNFPISGLVANTVYFIAVKFRDSSGWSLMSNVPFFNTLDTKKKITFLWDPNTETDLAGYTINCGTVTKVYGVEQNVGLTPRPSAPYAEMILDRGLTYFCAATAYDTDGNESGFSNEVTFTVN
jgi:hypothetical protein